MPKESVNLPEPRLLASTHSLLRAISPRTAKLLRVMQELGGDRGVMFQRESTEGAEMLTQQRLQLEAAQRAKNPKNSVDKVKAASLPLDFMFILLISSSTFFL